MKRLSICLLMAVASMDAANIYDNTSTDLFESIFFGSYPEVGDQITLAGAERLATDATVQLYNDGLAGMFDIVLRFYAAGAPVGAQIGPDFQLTGQSAPAGNVFDVSFSGLNTILPDEVIFTVEVLNADVNTALGVNLFDPPGNGSSNSQFLIVRNGGFSQIGAISAANVYFTLDASSAPRTAVPEPSSWLLTFAGAGALAAFRRFHARD